MKDVGDDFFREEKYYDAIFQYCMAILKGDDSIELYSNRSVAYIKLYNYLSAKEDIEICINKNPNNDIYWARLGYVLYKIGNYEKSILSYTKAYELKKEFIYKESIDIAKRKLMLNNVDTPYLQYLDKLSTNALETLFIKDIHEYINNPMALFNDEDIKNIIKEIINK